MTLEDSRLSPLAAFFPKLSRLYIAAGLARASNSSSRTRKAIATSLPRSLRYRLFPADNGVVLFTRWARQQGIRLVPANLTAEDSLFVPGSFWLGKYISSLVAQARAAGAPVTGFVHDMLLLSHPEWLPGRHSDQFRRGCETFLPSCAAILCNSRYTQEEVRRFVSGFGAKPIQTCRLADQAIEHSSPLVPAAVSEMLGKRYALFVSTITPRKNHGLLVAAWQCLWHELGAVTPYLLFVGGGAPAASLAALMARQELVGGRVIWLGSVEDDSLEELYRCAWLTIYPSLGEGYGLPVAEALSRGKVCLAAMSGGIREVSADLIDSIDPLEPRSVVARVKMYLSEPSRLAAREAEIRRRYRSTTWSETARTVRAVLERPFVQHGC